MPRIPITSQLKSTISQNMSSFHFGRLVQCFKQWNIHFSSVAPTIGAGEWFYKVLSHNLKIMVLRLYVLPSDWSPHWTVHMLAFILMSTTTRFFRLTAKRPKIPACLHIYIQMSHHVLIITITRTSLCRTRPWGW